MTTAFTSRLHFAAVVRRAIREGTLVSYERDHWMGRTAVLTDGTVLSYEPKGAVMGCTKDGPVNERGEDRDEQLCVEAERRKRRDFDPAYEAEERIRDAAPELLTAAKHAAMEWRLHGQLTDSCRVLEAAIAKAEGADPIDPRRV